MSRGRERLTLAWDSSRAGFDVLFLGADVAGLIAADRALYRAKEGGRDQVRSATSPGAG